VAIATVGYAADKRRIYVLMRNYKKYGIMINMKQNKIPHIVVDAFPLVDGHFSGVGHYTLGIVQGFDELARHNKITYDLVVPRRLPGQLQKYGLMNYRKIIKNIIPNKVIRQFMKYHVPFPCDIFLPKGAYYWFPSFLNWPLWFNKSGVVIHDVSYLDPEMSVFVDKGNREYLQRSVSFSVKNANTLLVPSSYTKQEMRKY
jgi:hypothetical protein